MEKKIIITTDDYGVIPSINKAVQELARYGKINSVAALANYKGDANYKSSAKNIKALQALADELERNDYKLQIGCHLTITSGKPLTDIKSSGLSNILLDGDNFREYTNLRRADTRAERVEIKKLIEEELRAQIEVVKDATGNKVSNLSCHHNSLNLFEEYYHSYLKVAKEFGLLPIRSPRVLPTSKDNMYYKVLRLRHLFDLDGFHRKHMKEFERKIHEMLKTEGVTAPNYLDGRHYGPIPVKKIQVLREKRYLKKKIKKFRSALNDFRNMSDSRVFEFMLHVANSSGKDHVPKDLDYTGINPAYFEGRNLEYQSAMEFDLDGMSYEHWSNL